MKRPLLILAIQILIAAALSCHADVPRIVYDAQAVDISGKVLPDGVHHATFRVYAMPLEVDPMWSETIGRVDVNKGRFHVELGRVNPLNLDWSRPYYVSTQFDSGHENAQRTPLYKPDGRSPLSLASSDLAYIAADHPLYEPTQGSVGTLSVPAGNWGADIGSYEGVTAYSNGVDTGSWSSLEPYGTDGYQYQCVELCRRFYRVHLGMSTVWYGDANSYYTSGPGWGLEQHPNNGTQLPQPDDILCFNGGAWGHVAIVTSATASQVNVIQENVSSTTGFGYKSIVNGIIQGTCQGWLHKPGNGSTSVVITQQPFSATVALGATATFGVSATGSGTLSYQWQKDSSNLSTGGHYSGATTTTLTISSCDANDVASYRCLVTDSKGSATTNSASLNVTGLPNVLLNGGFEGGNSGGVGTGWTSYLESGATGAFTIQTASPAEGTQYQQVQITTANKYGGVYQTVTGCTIGATYTIAGWMRTNSASATVSVLVDPAGGASRASAIALTPAAGTTSTAWVAFSGNVTATGTSITVFLNTAVTTTNKAGAFDGIMLTGNVCTPPVAPTSASASPAAIYSGASSTLTATGGSGTSCKWYSASCGGTLVGTGISITVSPTSTTTYYARWENTCGNSNCVITMVKVQPTVIGITPSSASNMGATSITNLAGTGFLTGATVKLKRTGDTDISATSVAVVSPTKITSSFGLTGKKTGLWDVFVQNTDGLSATLANGFGITVSGSLPSVGMSIRGVLDSIMTVASLNQRVCVWGKVETIDSSTFLLDDGFSTRIKVFAPGYTGLLSGDYASVIGGVDVTVNPPVLVSSSGEVTKY